MPVRLAEQLRQRVRPDRPLRVQRGVRPVVLLERTGGRYGLQTMCEGGGQANVTIIERV